MLKATEYLHGWQFVQHLFLFVAWFLILYFLSLKGKGGAVNQVNK